MKVQDLVVIGQDEREWFIQAGEEMAKKGLNEMSTM